MKMILDLYYQKQEWYPVTEQVRMMLNIVASTGDQFLSNTNKSASNDAWTTTVGQKSLRFKQDVT